MNIETEKYDKTLTLKVSVFGPSGVGKTSILYYLNRNRMLDNSAATIGASFSTYKKVINGVLVRLECWDVAGDPRYYSLTPMYLRYSDIIVLVYDLSDEASVENLEKYWFKHIDDNVDLYNEKVGKFLIGNKNDIKEPTLKNINMAANHNYQHRTTSAVTGSGIKSTFDEIIQYSIDNDLQQMKETLRSTINNNILIEKEIIYSNNPTKYCCST